MKINSLGDLVIIYCIVFKYVIFIFWILVWLGDFNFLVMWCFVLEKYVVCKWDRVRGYFIIYRWLLLCLGIFLFRRINIVVEIDTKCKVYSYNLMDNNL